MPRVISCALYTLFIELHQYPYEPFENRYNTEIRSLSESLFERKNQRASETALKGPDQRSS